MSVKEERSSRHCDRQKAISQQQSEDAGRTRGCTREWGKTPFWGREEASPLSE